ncbi:MAG: heparinase II/III family protein, partial [Candidatus Poribacteria bacterium]
MYDHDWWKNTASYRQYMALPRNIWTGRNNVVDIADCPRSNWYGPDYLLRALASEYNDGYAQWLAQQVDDADVDSPEARWLNLIWFDPKVQAKLPDSRPTMYHFDDMDIVSMRSDWSGDESLAVFKCGPFIGHEAVQEFDYDPGGGHVHPDSNHFVLFGCGEWLIRDDGYRAKWTGQHNTLLVNNTGQLGEGQMWFNGSEPLKLKALPKIIQAISTSDLDHITGDATEAYPRDIGLKHYIRHLLFLKPNNVLIVVDDVELDNDSEMELRFHPEYNQVSNNGDAIIIQGKEAFLRLELLTSEGVNVSVGDISGKGRHGENDFSMFTINLKTTKKIWRNAVAFSW